MEIQLPRTLSPSAITAFKDCPAAFKFSYIDRLPQPPSPAATKGTLVHRALERLMLRVPKDRTLSNALADLDVAREELSQHPDVTGLEMSEAEWQAFHADAESMVRRYFELEDPTTVRPIGLELKLTAAIGTTTLRGIIDRLELNEQGELVITDYKTGAVPHENYENTKMGGVHLYALLCEEVLGRRPVHVQLLYLSKAEAIIASPTQQSIAGAKSKTLAIWTAIMRACSNDDFRPKPGRLCDWCAYKPYCPAWGGDPSLAVELRDGAAQLPLLS